MENLEKKYKILKWILVIMVIIIFGLVIYIIFDKNIIKISKIITNDVTENEKNDNDNNVEVNENQDNFNSINDDENDINNSYIDIINKKIDEEVKNIRSDTDETHEITIYKNKRNNIYSAIIIDTESPCSMKNYYLHNITLDSGKELTSSEVLKELNITHENFVEAIRNGYLKFYEIDTSEYLKRIREEELEMSKEKIKSAYEEILKKDFDENDYKLFINNDGKLETIIDNKIWELKYPQVSERECGAVHYYNVILE